MANREAISAGATVARISLEVIPRGQGARALVSCEVSSRGAGVLDSAPPDEVVRRIRPFAAPDSREVRAAGCASLAEPRHRYDRYPPRRPTRRLRLLPRYHAASR